MANWLNRYIPRPRQERGRSRGRSKERRKEKSAERKPAPKRGREGSPVVVAPVGGPKKPENNRKIVISLSFMVISQISMVISQILR